MSPAHHRPAFLRCPPRAGGAPARILGTLLVAAGAWAACSPASAQMAPRGEHLLSQKAPGGGVTTAHVPWPARLSTGVSAQRGNGLSLRDNGPWPDWEGRIGAVIERPVNPVRDNFVLAQPSEGGLRMRSLHILADHYVEGGFRATVGLVSGDAGQAWWSGGNQDGGLSLSLQQLDTLGAPMGLRRRNVLPQAQAYLGAGYSTRSPGIGQAPSWRFNADFGLLNTDPDSTDRLRGVLLGDRSVGDVVRGLRLRPMVKMSLGYAF